MLYKVGQYEEGKDWITDWSTEIPKATAAGKYKIWYMVKGDAAHKDSEIDGLEVEVAKNTNATTGNTPAPGTPTTTTPATTTPTTAAKKSIKLKWKDQSNICFFCYLFRFLILDLINESNEFLSGA